MNPVHNKCGETLYTPRISFKKDGKTVAENTDHYWCRKCRCYVEVTIGKQKDLEEHI